MKGSAETEQMHWCTSLMKKMTCHEHIAHIRGNMKQKQTVKHYIMLHSNEQQLLIHCVDTPSSSS